VKKFLVAAIFGLAGLAAFAGTCTVTNMSIVQTDGSHMTIGGQVNNNSGANILQHNILVAFLDSGNNLVETQSVPGCLNSIPDGQVDFFSATSTHAASTINSSLGLARVAFDSTFRVGTTSSQNVSISNITANRTTSTTPATLTVAGTVTNNTGTLYAPNVCIVVRTSAGNVLITGRVSLSDISSGNNRTFSDTITVPNDSTASSVDIWVDGHDASGIPTTPQSQTGTSVATGGTVASHLSFSVQPVGNVLVNQAFATSPTVQILDASNLLVTAGSGSTLAVTLSVLPSSVPAGEAVPVVTCGSGNPMNAVAGVAAFTTCAVSHAGPNLQLTATASVTTATSNAFLINPGTATALSFSTQPVGSTGGLPFATQPVVRVVDATAGGGDTVWTGTNSNASITLAAITGPSTIAGCTNNPLSAVAGVATFANCSLALGGSYSLTAAAGGLTTATSTAFTMAPAPQTITFAALANHVVADSPVTVTATATSSLAVTFTTTSAVGICTVTTGGVVTLVGPGVCTIKADQAGNTQWNPAATVTQAFTIS
jgi:hypothetical protein